MRRVTSPFESDPLLPAIKPSSRFSFVYKEGGGGGGRNDPQRNWQVPPTDRRAPDLYLLLIFYLTWPQSGF